MKVEKITTNKVKFTFDVEVTEFDQALDHAFSEKKKDIEVKGFRKGQIPRKVYESKFGVESLYETALNQVFNIKFHEAMSQKEYQLVGEPKIDIDFAKVEQGKPFSFTFEIAVKPEVELGKYKGVEVEKLDDTVTDEEVDANIKQKLEQEKALELKEEGSLEKGDTAIFDFEGFVDGEAFEGGKAENFELEIGSGRFIPGFEDQMIGLNSGDEKDVEVTFPEEYQQESLAGKDATFKVVLHEIKVPVTAELTDEWVKGLEKEEATTVAELKANTKKQLEEAKARQNKNQTIEKALEKIAADSKVDIPVEMIEHEVKQAMKSIEKQAKQYGMDMKMYIQLTGMTEEKLNEQLKADSEVRILNSLIIEQIAKEEKYEISDDEVEAKYEELSKQYNMEVKDVKIHINPEMVKKDVSFSKAVETIVENLKFA